MELTLLHDWVHVDPIEQDRTTASGIVIPDSAAPERMTEAVVVRTGPGLRTKSGERIEPFVKAGDRVLLGLQLGRPTEINGEEVHLVREHQILLVLG